MDHLSVPLLGTSNEAHLLIVFYEPVRMNANEGKGQSGMLDSLHHSWN